MLQVSIKEQIVGKLWLSLVAAILVAMAAVQINAQQDLYNQAIDESNKALSSGNFKESFEAAKVAINLDGSQFLGYYFAALALYRGDQLDEAETYVASALSRAPVARRAEVEKLREAISQKRVALPLIKKGDEALQQGHFAQAAESYSAAWQKMPSEEATGLKAARLWIEKLSAPYKASPILHSIIEHKQNSVLASEAARLLESIRPELEQIFTESLRQGRRELDDNHLDDAFSAFYKAYQAMPERYESYIGGARAQTRRKNFDSAKKLILSAAKIKGASLLDEILNEEDFNILLDQEDFLNLINNVFGSEGVNKVQAVLYDKAIGHCVENKAALFETQLQALQSVFQGKQIGIIKGKYKVDMPDVSIEGANLIIKYAEHIIGYDGSEAQGEEITATIPLGTIDPNTIEVSLRGPDDYYPGWDIEFGLKKGKFGEQVSNVTKGTFYKDRQSRTPNFGYLVDSEQTAREAAVILRRIATICQ